METLLRQGAAARRLGGSVLQRTKAALTSPAVAEERRRLVPRRMLSTDKLSREEVGRQIQQKKEELYDLIANAEQSFWTRSFQNMRLQQHLSVQVNPRPWDREWRSLCFSRRVNSVVETAGIFTLAGVVSYGVSQYKACLAAREKLWAEVMKEEEQEASA